MLRFSPRSRFATWLALAGVGLALFFTGEYRDLGLPLGWLGMCLFVAAVWFSVAQLHAIPQGEGEVQVAPGEWQAWVGVAFSGAVIAAIVVKAHLFLPPLPIHRNPEIGAAGKSIGALFVAWLVLSQVLKQRWAGRVQADERDVRIALVAGQWARHAAAGGVVAIAVLLGFSDAERLRGFSHPFIAQMLMLALLAGLWMEHLVAAVLYRRDRRGAQA